MTLFELLSLDERIIVLSLVDDRVIYTWNRSSTLQCWRKYRMRYGAPDRHFDSWEEVGIQNLSSEPHTYEKARLAAIEWSQK